MKKLRMLHIGCGEISDKWLQVTSQHQGMEIVGLVDSNRTRAEYRQQQYNIACPIFIDYKEAIVAVEPDVIVDNTPPQCHFEIASFALAHQAHVLCEKPVSQTLEEAKKLLEEAKVHGKRVIVMQNRRYIKALSALRQIIRDGKIGEVSAVYSNFFTEAHFGGFRDEMDNPLLLEMAIHTFDQLRYLLDSKPEKVYCKAFNPKESWYKEGASVSCLFEMEKGVVYQYNGSWCAKGNLTSWESEWRVMGSKGAAYWNGKDMPWYETREADDAQFPTDYEREVYHIHEMKEGHEGCICDMIQALQEDKCAPTEITDNYYSIQMVLAAIESSRTSKEVSMI